MTVSAWERPRDADAVMKDPTHKSALIRMFKQHGLSEALHSAHGFLCTRAPCGRVARIGNDVGQYQVARFLCLRPEIA
jgi:hypothetical protein